MKTITQYREDIKNLMKKAGDIDAKCTAENRDPVASEVSLKNELLDTVEEYRKIVETQERQERVGALLEKPETPITKPGPQGKREDRPQDRFASLGHQMAAVMKAGQPGGSIDPRLFRAAEGSGLSQSVPSDGGLI